MAIKKYFGKQFRGKLRCIACALITIWALLIFNQTVTAQDKVKVKTENAQANFSKQMWRHFKDKFPEAEITRLDMQQTPYGPRGNLHIGDIKISSKIKKGLLSEDKIERARGIAQWFMKEEASTLGFTEMKEIRERNNKTDLGKTDKVSFCYDRYIGDLHLEGTPICITIDFDENISDIIAYLVPSSPELYKAVAKLTITEDEVRKIIEDDRNSEGNKVTVKNIFKVAVPMAPYVVWKAMSRGMYTINAFTGEIIQKIETQKEWQ